MTVLIACALFQQGLATPITFDAKDELLTDVAASVGKAAGIKITVDSIFSNAKVTVFVKDMPAKDLLDRLARLYDLDGTVKDKTYTFKFSTKHLKSYATYLDAEQLLRISQVHAKLEALAKLTLGASDDKAKPLDEAMKWALAHIDRPEYRVLGMWERGTNLKHPGVPLSEWYRYLMDGGGCNFWVGDLPPNTPLEILRGPGPAEAFMDAGSENLKGAAVQIAAYRTTGEIVVKPIQNISVTPDDPKENRPFADATPPKELGNTEFARELKDWQVPIPDKAIPTQNIDAESPGDPGYYDQKFSLTEKLEYLHSVSETQIIATSFRAPALSQTYPDAGSAKGILVDLQQKEHAILRWDDGCLMVRHPGYWLLECTEPAESGIRKGEEVAKNGPLNLFEYVSMAFLIAQHADAVPRWQSQTDTRGQKPRTLPRCFERLIDDRAFLTRFDPGPLEKDFPILMILGMMKDEDIEALSDGQKIDSWFLGYSVSYSRKFKAGPVTGITDTGKKLPSGQEILMEHRRWYADGWNGVVGPAILQQTSDLADVAADFAPTFSALISNEYFTRWEMRGGVHDHASGELTMLLPDDDPESSIWKRSKDVRARFIWLEAASPTYYRVCVGLSDMTVAVYDIEIGQSHQSIPAVPLCLPGVPMLKMPARSIGVK